MANESVEQVARKVSKAPYADDLRALYGNAVFDDPQRAFAAITEVLEVYQQEPSDFSPFSSKYDAYLRGLASLSTQEQRGLALFNEEDKGNCAHCHKSKPTAADAPPLSTDYGIVAIGVPRNRAIPANAESEYYDLELCGIATTALQDRDGVCGAFKAPSLRNVALRQNFFHNGVFHTLRDAVAFYAERDTNPEKWYPRNADGSIRKFDDLPTQYHEYVNDEPPSDRHPGDAPALSPEEVTDIVAFLQTLTDGYQLEPRSLATNRASPR